ncbi:hypothetical protein [Streptomyces sp. H27-D2]|uniref:hypothetical protein n=1 Tax=Streptomyces sp. H27-D2 TaxID=3046304 RepID=UPI002DB92836|nr:hypothetical protein [Streptomyces sp. H27-D2]MEC4017130.1 hypothetical protein [Streptomyces sp. H27-D2]
MAEQKQILEVQAAGWRVNLTSTVSTFRRSFAPLTTVLVLAVGGVGCSGMDEPDSVPATLRPATDGPKLDYTPATRKVEKARGTAEGISSKILDMAGIKGAKATESGAVASSCEMDEEDLYVMRHPWAISGVPFEELSAGFQRIRDNLSKGGWRINKYGPDRSPSKSLRILADSEKEQYSVMVVLRDRRKPNEMNSSNASRVSIIEVDVVSACFRSPDGPVHEY